MTIQMPLIQTIRNSDLLKAITKATQKVRTTLLTSGDQTARKFWAHTEDQSKIDLSSFKGIL